MSELTKQMSRLKSLRPKDLDLQARVILILVVVILPVSFVLTLAQSRLLAPLLNEEVKQGGHAFAENLAGQIESKHLLVKPNTTNLLEDQIQRLIYSQPSVLRVDVYGFSDTKQLIYLASSVEEAEKNLPPVNTLIDKFTTELSTEDGVPVWSIIYPVKDGPVKANIHVLVSLRLVTSIQSTILKFNLIAALFSTVLLIVMLSFFLRRAIENEKQLKVAQLSNEALSGRLQEIQQELIHKERLAVMGQLTASFAHEIGTPLNAIGGHMQLLNMDLEKASLPAPALKPATDRMKIIAGQLKKIEMVVKGFLSRTKTPVPEQRSITSVKELIERVLTLVTPTLQRHQISLGQEFLAHQDKVEVIPIEIEQVVLNLINNAIDSMKDKPDPHSLWVRTENDFQNKSLFIEIQDSGSGISDDNLKRIFKPFFTTKLTGEGHGLGLSICQEIVRSYGGDILVESQLEKGTTIKVQLPLKEASA